jgi:hypothetical protein
MQFAHVESPQRPGTPQVEAAQTIWHHLGPPPSPPSQFLRLNAYRCGLIESLPNYTADLWELGERNRGVALKPPIPFTHHEVRPTDSLAG